MVEIEPTLTLCRHCQARPAGRARKLCWTCHTDLAVRDMYPLTIRVNTSHVGLGADGRLPDEPTSARPGTEAKIVAMQARAELGQCLHHPADASFTGREAA